MNNETNGTNETNKAESVQVEPAQTEDFIRFNVVDEALTNEEKHEILTSHESIRGLFVGSAFFLSGIYFQLFFGA